MNILGIDIRSKSVYAAVIQIDGKHRRTADYAQQHAVNSENLGQILNEVLKKITEKNEINEAFISFGPDMVFYRNIEVPFSEPKKIESILPAELESYLPLPLEQIAADFKIANIGGLEKTCILSASVGKSTVESVLNVFNSFKIDPKVLTAWGPSNAALLLKTPDTPASSIFIEIRENCGTLSLSINRHIYLIRGLLPGITDISDPQKLCLFIEHTVISFCDQWDVKIKPEVVFIYGKTDIFAEKNLKYMAERLDIPVKKVSIADYEDIKIEASLYSESSCIINESIAASPSCVYLNFRKGDFAVKNKWKQFRKNFIATGILLFTTILLAFVSLFLENSILKNKVSKLDIQIKSIFIQTLPKTKKIVDPLQQILVKLREVQKSSDTSFYSASNIKAVEILNEINRLIPASVNLTLNRLNISPGMVLLSGISDTFNSVDDIKVSLEKSKYFKEVRITAASQEKNGKRINFKIMVQT